MAVTLKQVATRCGVSVQTVSCVLRGRGDLYRPETRQRVLQAARELGYRPNVLGRALVGGTSQSIGVMTRGFRNQPLLARIRGIMAAAAAAGYATYLRDLDAIGDDSEQFTETVRDLLARRVDGLLIQRSMPISPEARRFIAAQSVPTVFMDWGPPRWPYRLKFDRARALERVADHLHELGHRCVALFPSKHALDFPEQKILPYQRAFARHGMTLLYDRRWALEPEPHSESSAYEQVGRFLLENDRVTALVMGNDLAAVGALAAAQALGLRIPTDLSVVGYDDHSTAAFVTPPLTTIRSPREPAGKQAFQMLYTLMTEPKTDVTPQGIPLDIVARASTGPAPPAPPRGNPTAGQEFPRDVRSASY